MNVGVNISSHGLNFGGGWKAALWHIKALKALHCDVTVFATSGIRSENQAQLHGIPTRWYYPGIESQFDGFLTLNHFGYAQTLAKLWNVQHMFFPQSMTPPPEGLTLTANSAYTARHIQHRWNRDAKAVYIPIENYYHCDNKERIILHVSRLSEPNEWADKSHRQIIQAFKLMYKQLPGWKLVVAGAKEKNQDYYIEELMRSASQYPVEFLLDPQDSELVSLYAKSSILIHATGASLPNIPSAQEHFGITPLEAQASGCVPIVYNSGGMPEVVLDHQTGLLFDNIMDLPHMTLNLLNHMGDWAAMSQAGQLWASEWENFDAFVGRIDDMLNNRQITPMKPFELGLKYSPADVTAVIPTYNSALLSKLLESLKETSPDMKVLIINNGDPLSGIEVRENVEVVDTGENLGFAGAHKLASGIVKTPLILMLNDDMEAPNKSWLEQLLFLMNNDSVGVVGPKLLFGDGRLQFAGGVIDWNREDIGYHRNYGGQDGVDVSTPLETDFVTGAALLCRKELYEIPDYLVGNLNMEDAEICFNAREKGLKVIYQPASVVTHFEGETKKRTPEAQDKVNRNREEFKKRWIK